MTADSLQLDTHTCEFKKKIIILIFLHHSICCVVPNDVDVCAGVPVSQWKRSTLLIAPLCLWSRVSVSWPSHHSPSCFCDLKAFLVALPHREGLRHLRSWQRQACQRDHQIRRPAATQRLRHACTYSAEAAPSKDRQICWLAANLLTFCLFVLRLTFLSSSSGA